MGGWLLLLLQCVFLSFFAACSRVLVQKHPQLRTVVLKTGIGEKWRELLFELVAGEADYVAKVVSSTETTHNRAGSRRRAGLGEDGFLSDEQREALGEAFPGHKDLHVQPFFLISQRYACRNAAFPFRPFHGESLLRCDLRAGLLQKESDLVFEVDYSKAFWNSRWPLTSAAAASVLVLLLPSFPWGSVCAATLASVAGVSGALG